MEECCTWHFRTELSGHWLAGRVSWLLMVYKAPDSAFTGGKLLMVAFSLLGLQVTCTGPGGKNPCTRQAMTTYLAESALQRPSGKTVGLVLGSATQDAL